MWELKNLEPLFCANDLYHNSVVLGLTQVEIDGKETRLDSEWDMLISSDREDDDLQLHSALNGWHCLSRSFDWKNSKKLNKNTIFEEDVISHSNSSRASSFPSAWGGKLMLLEGRNGLTTTTKCAHCEVDGVADNVTRSKDWRRFRYFSNFTALTQPLLCVFIWGHKQRSDHPLLHLMEPDVRNV